MSEYQPISTTIPDPAIWRGLPSLESLIDRYELAAKKSFGQHFLLDGNITDRVALTAGNLRDCHVIEIGPGPGGLTRSLLKAGAKKVIAIEKDARCLPILHELQQVAGERLEIIEADALEFDAVARVPAPRKIVANLPYNVGTQMLIGWLEDIYKNATAYDSLTLMFQKEVAERIVAAPNCKDYGRLSVLAQWLCHAHMDFELPPEAFTPPPKVSSAVVTLTPREKPLVDVDIKTLEKVMAAAFGQRRKMLRGALKSLDIDTEALLAKAGIPATARAEAIDVATLCGLAKTYQRFGN